MKRHTLITICLTSFLLGLGYHVWSQTLPPMPKAPRKAAATETKGATLLVQKAAVVIPPQIKTVPIRLPFTNYAVWRAYRVNGSYYGSCDGDVVVSATNTTLLYFRAELSRNDFLRYFDKKTAFK